MKKRATPAIVPVQVGKVKVSGKITCTEQCTIHSPKFLPDEKLTGQQ